MDTLGLDPLDRSNIHSLAPLSNRPKEAELLSVRAYLLLFLKQLMQQPKYETQQEVYCPEEELNALTNFLLTVHEDQNILDILQLGVRNSFPLSTDMISFWMSIL